MAFIDHLCHTLMPASYGDCVTERHAYFGLLLSQHLALSNLNKYLWNEQLHLVETGARPRRGLDYSMKCMRLLSFLGNISLFCSGRFSLPFPPERQLLGVGIVWAWLRMDCLSPCGCRTCSPVARIPSNLPCLPRLLPSVGFFHWALCQAW